MATSRNIHLLTDCLICGLNRTDKTPRLLTCKHGFCQECLLKTSSIQKAGELQCPVCLEKTQLSENGVRGLKADTMVSRVSGALGTLKGHYTCALCILQGEKKDAVAWCTNCEFRLCDTCVEDHKKKPRFSSHVFVEKLCKTHIRDLSHACLTCRAGICYDCILSSFHDDHKTCDITEMKEKAIAMMIKGKNELKQEIEIVDKLMNKTMDESMKVLNERRKQTEEKLESHRKKMMEAFTSCLENREKEFNRLVMEALGDQNEACSNASNCLNEINMVLEKGKIEILQQLTEKTNDIFRSLNTLRTAKGASIRIPELEEDGCSTKTDYESRRIGLACALGRINAGMALDKMPNKILELKKLKGKDKPIEDLYFIAACGDGSAVLGLNLETYAVQVNPRGDIIGEFHTQSGSYVRGVDIYQGDLFLLSIDPHMITRFNGLERQGIDLNGLTITPWDLVIDDDSFVVTGIDADVFRYSQRGVFQQKICRDQVYRISLAVHPVYGKVYFVSTYEELYVFKPDGELVRKIGGTGSYNVKFDYISGCTMLPNNHILITDVDNDKVTEVTFEGEFIRHLLTKKDGIKEPTDVSFNYPYLWVACREMLFLFKYPEL